MDKDEFSILIVIVGSTILGIVYLFSHMVLINYVSAEENWDCLLSDQYPKCAVVQPQANQTASILRPYIIVFSEANHQTYDNIDAYRRNLVIAPNAYTMGYASDTYAKQHNIELVLAAGYPNTEAGERQYMVDKHLNHICCGDKAIQALTATSFVGGEPVIEEKEDKGMWQWFALLPLIIPALIALSKILHRSHDNHD